MNEKHIFKSSQSSCLVFLIIGFIFIFLFFCSGFGNGGLDQTTALSILGFILFLPFLIYYLHRSRLVVDKEKIVQYLLFFKNFELSASEKIVVYITHYKKLQSHYSKLGNNYLPKIVFYDFERKQRLARFSLTGWEPKNLFGFKELLRSLKYPYLFHDSFDKWINPDSTKFELNKKGNYRLDSKEYEKDVLEWTKSQENKVF